MAVTANETKLVPGDAHSMAAAYSPGPSRRFIDMPDVALANQPPEVQLFLADVRSLVRQINDRRLANPAQFGEEIAGIADAAVMPTGLALARAKFDTLTAEINAIWQAASRRRYAAGLFFGLTINLLLGVAFYAVAKTGVMTDLTDPGEIVSLIFFSSIGTFASVMGRLSDVDIGSDANTMLLSLSAIARPLISIAFASVVFVILKNNVITIASCSTPDTCKALRWVAEFLCGYSERFAPDLIARVSFDSASSDSKAKPSGEKSGAAGS